MAKSSRSGRLQQIRQRGFFTEGSDEEQVILSLSVDSGTPVSEQQKPTTTKTNSASAPTTRPIGSNNKSLPSHPTIDPYVGKLERYELFCTNQAYYLV